MKIRHSVFWFAAVCALLVALLMWFGRKPAEKPSPTVADTNVAPQHVEHSATEPNQTKSAPARSNAPVARLAPSASAPATPLKTEGEKIREGLAEMNDVPIVFYGKLEDQFRNPVPGAQIAGNTIIYNGSGSGAKHLSVTSDANGFFQINAGKGESLGIWPRKEGYALATTGTEFKYSYMYPEHFTPDANNPVIFKMWKLQGAEPLTGIDQRYKFRFTDGPVNFDLLAGKIVPTGGDIKITISRSPGIVSERTLQDWSVQVEAVDGGLIKTSVAEARVTFQLPDEGYPASDLFIMSTNPPNKWFGGVDQMYFVKSRNGQAYSKLNFGVSINQKPEEYVRVELHGELNPNGSRNFEADANAIAMRP
jgi:hypothetical protein